MEKSIVTHKVFTKQYGTPIVLSPVMERLDCGSAYAELNGLTNTWFCYGQAGKENYPYLVDSVREAAHLIARIHHYNATGDIRHIPVRIVIDKE